MDLAFTLQYEAEGKSFTATTPSCKHFTLDIRQEGKQLFVTLQPKTALKITDFTVKYPYRFKMDNKIFVNGYQSWTDSLEYEPCGQMQELSRLMEFIITKSPVQNTGLGRSGDCKFHKYPRKPGVFFGWSYGYVRRGNTVDIFGSLDERCGYTIVTFDANQGCVLVSKDLEGVTFREETALLAFTTVSGEYDEAFDAYFSEMGVTCRETKRRVGYTTWYNYYGNINEGVVLRDLNSLAQVDMDIDCFQIDDGYQNAIGDWLITDQKKFPNGMKPIADKIHESNMLAGLWLAPFAGVPSSKLYKEHSDWFIKDENGKPYKTGHNWGGFYSLDIYNPDVRDYLKHVFDVVLNDWGYDLVKLDFLYGACILPMHNKTRGEIMCDAMDLIREWCGDKLVLGCGVPMMPAFGKVDYCRIGSDVALDWKHKKHICREEVSTPHAICNTVFRRHLDGRAWQNDPDVFLLREKNIQTDMEQRKLVARIDAAFGSLMFISDNVEEYNDEQLQVLKETFSKKDVQIKRAEFVNGSIMELEFTENGEAVKLKFDAHTGRLYL